MIIWLECFSKVDFPLNVIDFSAKNSGGAHSLLSKESDGARQIALNTPKEQSAVSLLLVEAERLNEQHQISKVDNLVVR